MDFYEIINNIDITFLVDKIENIKKEPLINIRSTLICELLKIRAKEIIKSFGPCNNNKIIPNKTVDFFFRQIFELNDEKINIPPYYLKRVAKELLNIERPYDYEESELRELYNKNGITDEKIYEEILTDIYDYETLNRIYESNITASKYSYCIDSEEELFSMLIILDDDFKKVYKDLLKCYYCFIENEFLNGSDKLIRKELNNPSEIQRTLKIKKMFYPNAYLENNTLYFPIFEEIMLLEKNLISEFITYFDAIEMVDLHSARYIINSSIFESISYPRIKNQVMMIDKTIQEVENTISKRKAKQAEDAYKVVIKEEFVKELAKTTKKKYILQGKKKSKVVFYLEELIKHRDSISSKYISSTEKINMYVKEYNPKRKRGHGSKTAILNFFNKHRKIIASLYEYDEDKISDVEAYSLLQHKDIIRFKKLINELH